jgi:2-polyprenyl-3-methyl-5-hydroxy-6-metoxy-1,4-benzoquinol methylase
MTKELNFHPIENSSDTAEIIVPILIDWYKPKSVLDLGCNVGWWLRWFYDNGVTDIFGIDGDNMIDSLVIPESKFNTADLTEPIRINDRFDLLLCLEVAEHLEEQFADTLVQTCVNNSDTIFFSAATKGQGGYHHVNEQPHQYWIDKFLAHGYTHRMLDETLPVVPHDYYRKNAIEFKKK